MAPAMKASGRKASTMKAAMKKAAVKTAAMKAMKAMKTVKKAKKVGKVSRALTAAELKEWKKVEQEGAKKADQKGDEDVDFGDMVLTCKKSVFHPGVWDLSGMYPELYKAFKVKPGCRFMDMGTGLGYFGLKAAQQGCFVLATDIMPAAVANATLNAKRLGLDKRMICMVSDVYSALEGSDQTFDVIWWHHPYGRARGGERKSGVSDVQMCNLMDEGYKLLGRFLKESKKYLAPGGRVLVCNGEQIGDRKLFNRRVAESGASAKIVKQFADPTAFLPGVFFTEDLFEITYP